MNLQTVLDDMVAPAQQILGIRRTPQSDVIMLAIGLQESRFTHRRQIGGPAVGYWQFEKGGGVRGVLTHHASAARAAKLCVAQGVAATETAVYGALPLDDVLAAGFARLLLLTDPKPLPAVGDEQGAWAYYLRNWRPGKPHAGTWPALYLQAMEALS